MSRFDAIAAEWDKGDMRQQLANATAQAIAAHIELTPTMDLLDFGAGTGLLTYKVLPQVRSVTAVDTSEQMLAQLQTKNTPEHQVKTICADITAIPLETTYDGVISSMAMHHVEDTAGFLKTLYDHLNPGGFIAIADLDKEDGSFHSHSNDGVFHFGFERDALQRMAESTGFETVTFNTSMIVKKPEGDYPIFLFVAHKAA